MIKVEWKTDGNFWFKDFAGRQRKNLPKTFKDAKEFQAWLWDNIQNVIVTYCGTVEDDLADFTAWGNRFSTVMTLLTKVANTLNKTDTGWIVQDAMVIRWHKI